MNDALAQVLFYFGASHSVIVQDFVISLKLAPKVLK